MSAFPDIDWISAVGRVVWVPSEHRVPNVSLVGAKRMLRCSEASFAQLVELGLPYEDGPAGRVFDAFDLKNVALASGSGVTAVEVSMRYVLEFMSAQERELTKPLRSRYLLRAQERRPDAEHGWRVYRPAPEAFGGTLHSWSSAAKPPRIDGDCFVVVGGNEVTGAMTTVGRALEVCAEAVRSMMWDLLDSGVRWHYLPASMVSRPNDTIATGAASCSVLCRVLEQQLRAAGFEAIAYHGWINAAAPVDHGWVEVVDDDGRVKCLDPSLALLAVRNGFGTRAFASFATGSMLNRIVPTRAPVHVPFAEGSEVVLSCSPEEPAPRSRRGGWRRTGLSRLHRSDG